MNKLKRGALALLTALGCLFVQGCAGPVPPDYAQEKPALDLRQYFNGPVKAHGIFTDRSGRVVKRFVVDMRCEWQGTQGTLDERFTYSDGTQQRRVWHLTDLGNGRYRGQADDVVGEAKGHAAGNALQWRYTLALPVDGRVWHVQFDDWMFLVDAHTMINRAAMSKFGVHLGDVTLSFSKPVSQP